MWLGLWKPGISADSAQITQVQKMILFFWCVFMIFMFCKLLLLSYWYVNKAWRFYCHSFFASKDIVSWTSKISLKFVCRYALFLQARLQIMKTTLYLNTSSFTKILPPTLPKYFLLPPLQLASLSVQLHIKSACMQLLNCYLIPLKVSQGNLII